MRKIGKGNDTHAAHPHGFAQHGFSIAQMLQGVYLQNHIKTLVTKHGQALVQVELDHLHTTLHTGQHIGVVNFHAITGAAMLRLQVGQQLAIAATQVKHPAAKGHHAGHRVFQDLVHAWASKLMRSK